MGKYKHLLPVLLISVILAIAIIRNLESETPCHSGSTIMMDTLVEVTVWGVGEVTGDAAIDSAFWVMAKVESLLGDGMVDGGTDHGLLATEELQHLLKIARSAYEKTDGMFDPTIGAVSRLWQFGYEATPPPLDSLRSALERVGFQGAIDRNDYTARLLDLGGIAKGYAVELAADRLRSLGFSSAIINAGGDLRLIGKRTDGKPWRIAIRHPRKDSAFIGYLDLEDVAVATSGDYERYFIWRGKRYHHILNPATGMPGGTLNSVTVVASDAAVADAMATGLFLLAPERGLEIVEMTDGTDAVFAAAEGESVMVSSGLAGLFGRFGPD